MTLRSPTKGNKELFAAEFTSRWTKFRDALRHEDQLVLDQMFQAVDIHPDAVNAMDGNAFDKQFMAMMIEQRRMGDEIDKKLTEIEKRARFD